MKEKILLVLAIAATGATVHSQSKAIEKKLDKAKNKSIEIIQRDQHGEPLEYIAERELKKEKNKSGKPQQKVTKTVKNKLKAANKDYPSRLELWKKARQKNR